MERIITAELQKPGISKQDIVKALYSGLSWIGTDQSVGDTGSLEKDRQLWLDSLSLPGEEPYQAPTVKQTFHMAAVLPGKS